jgi:lysophospholipase L1-like esterase
MSSSPWRSRQAADFLPVFAGYCASHGGAPIFKFPAKIAWRFATLRIDKSRTFARRHCKRPAYDAAVSLRNSLKIVAINFVVLIAGALVVEVCFRSVSEGYSDEREFRATQPPPYRNAPFFSAEFIDESFSQPGGWRALPGTNAILPNDFKGKYFTVENGLRRTTDVPHDATVTIYLFGGSTLYNSEVPDDHTVASYLQRELVEAGFGGHRVVNFGVTSVSTQQQVERLRAATIAAGDSVVFYDGVNDVLQGVLYGNVGDTIYGNDRARSFGQRLLYRLSKRSVAARYLLARANANYKIGNLDARAAWTADRFRTNLAEAEQIAREKGASFSHFLQPTLYSLARRSDYENGLLTFGFVPAQAEEAFVATYPLLEQIVAARAHHGFADFDLTAVFDALEGPVYLDGWHINHRGNEVVAEHILAGLVAAKLVR